MLEEAGTVGDPVDVGLVPGKVDLQLVLACENGNLCHVKTLTDEGADICYQDSKTGISVLMVAASAGHTEIVRYLLQEGAPWNAVDRAYMCAGDYAAKHGHQDTVDLIMDHAVMSELLLSLTVRGDRPEYSDGSSNCQLESAVFSNVGPPNVPLESLNAVYLLSRLEYSEDGKRLVDTGTNLAVMMDWERPLMARHAEWICHADKDEQLRPQSMRILNVGFGMGIVDEEIQRHKPTSHVIIEAHSEVVRKITANGWTSKPGVRVICDRWQDAIRVLAKEIEDAVCAPFDGIFFDTYAEDDLDLREFHSWLPKLLRPPRDVAVDNLPHQDAGRYSYYNGVCPDNVFFHGVACETIRLHLNR
ncbi:type IV protein arginine methyltransferase [Paragonimus westermani]|uniref:Type IV protein arginine methyltransferase n=1 Tax=Paragonimus westermani TaxID=34504 RepID=A0A5J4NXE8_9TREM|nr:type IV protein arginine methyltransferase [Paragonimus westermani]